MKNIQISTKLDNNIQFFILLKQRILMVFNFFFQEHQNKTIFTLPNSAVKNFQILEKIIQIAIRSCAFSKIIIVIYQTPHDLYIHNSSTKCITVVLIKDHPTRQFHSSNRGYKKKEPRLKSNLICLLICRLPFEIT